MSTPRLKVLSGQVVDETSPPARKKAGNGSVNIGPGSRNGVPAVSKLAGLQDLKHDALKVYRAARKGSIPTDELSRYMYAIDKVGDVIERADIEPRIEALEQRLLTLSSLMEQRR